MLQTASLKVLFFVISPQQAAEIKLQVCQQNHSKRKGLYMEKAFEERGEYGNKCSWETSPLIPLLEHLVFFAHAYGARNFNDLLGYFSRLGIRNI